MGQLELERTDFLQTERHPDRSADGGSEVLRVAARGKLSGVWFRLPDLFAGCSTELGL